MMTVFTIVLAAMLAAILAAWAVYALYNPVSDALKRIGNGQVRTIVFALMAIGAVYVGGSKHIVGRITFSSADPENRYIIDAGSFVTNDYVHVSYTKAQTVPTSAGLFIERRRLDQTNDTDWVEHLATTFAASPSPFDIQFSAASNWNWIVYTDWTPGPSVQTNGVWHTWWAKPNTNSIIINGRHILPIRAIVRDNGSTLATPKAKKESHQ